MDCYSVLRSHFIKLIDADDSTISKHHGSSFKLEISCCWIFDNRCCQTSSWGSFSTCVHWNRGNSVNKFQELRLGNRWITQEQYIDITSQPHTIRKLLSASSKKQASNGFLNIRMTIDWRSNTLTNLLIDLWVSLHLLKFLLIFLRDVWHRKAHSVRGSIWVHARLKAQDFDVAPLDVLFDLFVSAGIRFRVPFSDTEDTHNLDSVSRSASIGQFSVHSKHHRSWHFSCWDVFWSLLQLDDLLIDELTFVSVHFIRVQSAILFLRSADLVSWANDWRGSSVQTEWDVLMEFMTAVGAVIDSFSSSNIGLACWCNDTSYANDFSHTITLKLTEFLRDLAGGNLNLESWR